MRDRSPPRAYWAAFAALLALTATTVAVAYVDLGALNAAAAFSIAVVKAALVVTIFMRLGEDEPLVWLWAGAGVVWLVFLLTLTLSDSLTRGWPS